MLIQNFLSYLKVSNKSENTITNYSIDLNEFESYLKLNKGINLDVDSVKLISMFDLDNYLLYLQQKIENNKQLSSATRARKTITLKSFFKYIHNKELVDKNVAKNITTPKIEKKIPIFLTPEDSQKLLNGITHTRNKTMIAMLLMTGLRISELISLNVTDIIDNSVKIKGKGNKERYIKLNNQCAKQINNYLLGRKQKDNEMALFTTSTGNKMTKIAAQKMIKKEIKNILGYENVSAHKLRHSFCSMMHESGVDTISLKEMMGHNNIKTTELYTHLSKKHIDSAFEKNPLAV